MRLYYQLVKPGIVYGNLMTALAAFLFASHMQVNVVLLLATLLGLALSIASACVVNNVLDRDIDAHMERTKNRALVLGQISVRSALIYASLLALVGFSILALFSTWPAFFVTAGGVFVYLCLYTPAKRSTQYSTLVGAVSGAVPPVVGYVAVTNMFDVTSLLLFLILVCWQMTHFFSIALFRMDEYRAAGLPVMSVHVGIMRTQVLMLAYIVLFAYAIGTFAVVNNLGLTFTLPMGVASLGWILLSLRGFTSENLIEWGRRMFFYSLTILLLFSLLLAIV